MSEPLLPEIVFRSARLLASARVGAQNARRIAGAPAPVPMGQPRVGSGPSPNDSPVAPLKTPAIAIVETPIIAAPQQRTCKHCGAPLKAPTPPITAIRYNITPRMCAAAVEEATGVSAGEIFSPWRPQRIAVARFMAIALTKDFRPDMSMPVLGRAFNRDHSSIMSALRRHVVLMDDAEYAARYAKARELVEAGR